jgi:hypothetical protein
MYTELGMQLKVLPPMSKNAQGNNYEVSISSSEVMRNLNIPVLNVDVKKMMKPVLASLSEKYRQKLNNTRTTSLELSAAMHSTKEMKTERCDEIEMFDQNIAKLEEQIAKEKEAMELAAAKADKETDLCEELIYKLRHEPSPNMSSLRNELHQVKAQ